MMAFGVTPLGPLLLVDSHSGMDGDCNSGTIRLPASVTSATASVRGGVLYDANGDGSIDLAVLLGNGSVSVALNNGNATFTVSQTVSLSQPAVGVTVLDADADGSVDVLMTSASSSALALGSSSGVLTVTAIGAMAGLACIVAVPVDMNGDGDIDVVAVTASRVVYLENTGGGVYVDASTVHGLPSSTTFGAAAVSAIPGDINNDGTIDIVVLCADGSSTGLLQLSSGTFVVLPNPFRGIGSAVLSSQAAVTLFDVDNDGDVDAFVSTLGMLVNNGSGSFVYNGSMLAGVNVSSPVAAVAVDVNGDGALDVPAVGFVNALPANVAARRLMIRLLSRGGGWNQFGARVCIRAATGAAFVACRVVDGGVAGGSAGSQSVYDVHFGVPERDVGYDVEAAFVNGHRHNKTTARKWGGLTPAVSGNVTVLSDVPVVAAAVVVPTSGLLVAGSVVTVVMTALWNEGALVPDPSSCCVVNGVNVSSSFVSFGNGSYTLRYVVSAGDADVFRSAPSLQLALRDRTHVAAVSDVVDTTAQPSWMFSGFSIDTHAPQVTFTCVAWNNTVRPTNYETLCVSCGAATNESVLGCSVYYQLYRNGGAVGGTQTATQTGVVNASIATAFVNGDAVVVVLWAVDASGNVGPATSLVWVVDSLLPVTVWPSVTQNVTLTSDRSPQFVLGCNRACHFAYRYGARLTDCRRIMM